MNILPHLPDTGYSPASNDNIINNKNVTGVPANRSCQVPSRYLANQPIQSNNALFELYTIHMLFRSDTALLANKMLMMEDVQL
jgi:hypothetical protein